MNRIERLKQKLGAGFGAALVSNGYNRSYLTGMMSSAGTVVITEKSATLIIDFRYIEAAKARAKGVEVVLQSSLYDQIRDILSRDGVSSVHIEQQTTLESAALLRKELRDYTLVEDSKLSSYIDELRAIKDEGEVAAIEAAQAITDAAFDYICGYIKPGMSEREVAAELEYYMRKKGADGLAFSTICVAGVKSSMPHGEPDENIIKKGDFVTMDYGALKGGYCSDMTRTVAVGSVSDEQRKVYDTVLRAHLAATEAAKPGITGRELDAVARGIIDDAGYEGCFGHGLGHSLGLEIHEQPRASAACDTALADGTIMTIEPGIYLEGRFGVRIENMVLIEGDGCRVLTASPRELIVL